MNAEQNGIPVPPEGSPASEQGARATETTSQWRAPSEDAQKTSGQDKGSKEKKKDKKGGASGNGSFGKSFLGGVVGAVVVVALVLGLWAGTPVFDGLKGSSGTTVTTNSGTITVTGDTEATAAEAVAAKDLSSVVTIYVYSDTSSSWSQLFGNSGSSNSSSSEPSALGSGVVVQQDGNTYYILTNYHVVEGISKAVVKVGDNQYEASSVGYDSKSDLAVIKITDDNNDLTVASWGDSDSLVVGQWVAAIGSPYGYENTLTTGVVSAKYRSDVLSSETGVGSTVYTDMIQTDAAINPGNSGGGLFDAEGNLVGINTYISSTSESSAGLGFAIPASTAKDVADQLISGKTVEHAFLGISMSSSTNENGGVTVAAVYKDSAAAKAGLKTGDIITKIDDTEVSSADDVSEAVSSHSVGDSITITYTRDGSEKTATATLGSDSDASEEYADGGEPESSGNSGSGNSGNGNSGNSGNSGNGYYDLNDLFGDMFGYGYGSGSGSDNSGSGSGNSGSSGSGDGSGSFWN